MGTGKEYRKEYKGIKGAALFYLAFEQSGAEKLGGAKEIIKAAFRDLGVTKQEVEQYIRENHETLREILASRNTRDSA